MDLLPDCMSHDCKEMPVKMNLQKAGNNASATLYKSMSDYVSAISGLVATDIHGGVLAPWMSLIYDEISASLSSVLSLLPSMYSL